MGWVGFSTKEKVSHDTSKYDVMSAGNIRHLKVVQYIRIQFFPFFFFFQFPEVEFTANPAMVASPSKHAICKRELEGAVKGGWHQGQAFFYRCVRSDLI